jgi:hypothetical protein
MRADRNFSSAITFSSCFRDRYCQRISPAQATYRIMIWISMVVSLVSILQGDIFLCKIVVLHDYRGLI